MTFITILIIVVFVVGYALIALESATHINKAAVALLMCVACWTLYMVHPADYLPGVTTDLLSSRINTIIEEHLGSIPRRSSSSWEPGPSWRWSISMVASTSSATR